MWHSNIALPLRKFASWRSSQLTPAALQSVPLVLGLILSVAAALKTYELATGATTEESLLTSRWLLLPFVEFELALGLWLLTGFWAGTARLVALATFALLFFVSLSHLLKGDASCGCFGKLAIHPGYTLIFDVAATAGIFLWRPAEKERETRLNGIPPISPKLALFGLIATIPGWVLMASCQQDHSSEWFWCPERSPAKMVFDPYRYLGKAFPLAVDIDIEADLTIGDWLVILYQPGCPKCHRTLSTAVTYVQDRHPAERIPIAVIIQSSHSVQIDFNHSAIVPGRLGEEKWVVKPPVVLRLSNGILESVFSETTETSPLL